MGAYYQGSTVTVGSDLPVSAEETLQRQLATAVMAMRDCHGLIDDVLGLSVPTPQETSAVEGCGYLSRELLDGLASLRERLQTVRARIGTL